MNTNTENDKQFRISLRRFFLLVLGMVSLLAIVVFYIKETNSYENKVVPGVAIEAGTPLELSYFTDDTLYVKPTAPLENIDTTVPGVYPLSFCFDNRTYESTLTIRDTVPPEGEVRDLTTDVTVMPDLSDFIVSYSDVTAVTPSFEVVPDVSTGGVKDGSIKFTDTSGNTTVLPVQVTVIDDFEAPKIFGIHKIEIYEGDTIQYREGITVEDDKDPKPKLSIDNSGVNANVPGEYKIFYTATDSTGNSRTYDTTITVMEKPEGYMDPEEVYTLANEVLERITTPDMTVEEKGFMCYFWCKDHINYVGTSDKTHWTKGAYEGFTKLGGDCYTYAACAKAFFDVLGLDNYLIERIDPGTSTHYWNYVELDGQWYFVDCSRTNTPLNGYLLTEKELDALNAVHGPRYHYDHTGLPNAATESIQYRFNYGARRVNPPNEG